MNHCVLEVQVKEAPTVRYTQDNKTPIAEMEVLFEGLRAEDSQGNLKVVGWGNLATELQNQVQIGQKLMLEGRLRMNTVPREDGLKEKRAELTLARFHPIVAKGQTVRENESQNSYSTNNSFSQQSKKSPANENSEDATPEELEWNSSPLIPETDDIPF